MLIFKRATHSPQSPCATINLIIISLLYPADGRNIYKTPLPSSTVSGSSQNRAGLFFNVKSALWMHVFSPLAHMAEACPCFALDSNA